VLGGMLTNLSRFRLLIVAAAVGLLVVGGLSLRRMHADVLPELGSGPVLMVQTEALGLSSQEVEQYVTVPLENNLLDGVMGVWDVRSRSIPGLSAVDLYFQPGVSTLRARQLVEERLTNAFSLPNVSKPPQLIQPLSSSGRAVMIGLSSKSLDPLQLSYLARWVVKPRLSGVAGVANVTIFGQKDRQLQVMVNPSRLAAHHITLNQVISTAGNAQLVSPLSYLQGSSPGTGGFLDGPNQRLEIRPVLPIGAPHQLAAAPIEGSAGRIPLGSVTNVVRGHQPMIGDAITAHGSGLVLLVQKLPSASLPGVTSGIDRALGDLRPALRGVSVDSSFFRPASYESDALDNVGLALLIAAALALVALGALVLDIRGVVIAASAMLFSLLGAAVLLKALGYTLNALVILGLLIASAAVVDDATQPSYAIAERLRGHGRPGDERHAGFQTIVRETCAQLRAPLVFASAIAVLAVAPVLFSGGISARFVHPTAVAFAVAVVASLVIALVLTPALALVFSSTSGILDGRLSATGTPRRAVAIRASILAFHQRLLLRAMALPDLLAVVCVTGLAGAVALPFLEQPAPPAFRDRNLVVQWAGPAGASLGEMDRITRRTVGELRALPGVQDVAATLGRAVGADQLVDTSSGQIFVALGPSAPYDAAVSSVRNLVQSVPGIQAAVGTYESDVTQGALTPSAHQAVVRVYGQDYGQLQALANNLKKRMAQVPKLGQARVALPAQEPNVDVAVNDQAALRAGVLPGDARRQASTLVSGLTVGNFFVDQAVFDVTVQDVQGTRSTVGAVRNLLIDTSDGGHIPLGQIANVTVRPDPIDIQHQAMSRYVDVIVPLQGLGLGAAHNQLRSIVGQLKLPLGYHAEVVGSTPEDATSHVAFLSYVLAAAIGILLLLQAALRSWRLAALVFLSIPAAISGGLLEALISGHFRSLGTAAGLIGVFAFAIRQGILSLTSIRRRQAVEGGPLTSATVVQAAGERLPVSVGSAAVAAVALLPFVVIGNVPGNEITHVAAAVMLAGLLSSLLFVHLVLPATYFILGPHQPIEEEETVPELMMAGAASANGSIVPTLNGNGVHTPNRNGNGAAAADGNGVSVSNGAPTETSTRTAGGTE
jgi:Cu/Ag efflux pump CusA